MAFRVVADISEIKKLNKYLSDKLIKRFAYSESRTIGYPAGNIKKKIKFQNKRGESVLWWSAFKHRDSFVNLFGHANPNQSGSVYIDIQFNFPSVTYSKKKGGVFLIENETGNIYLAHRAIVTRGRARVKKERLFEFMSSTICEADDNGKTVELLLVAILESKTLIDDISNFAIDIRCAANLIVENQQHESEESEKKIDNNGKFGELKNYFREFSGIRKSYKPKKVYSKSIHGHVVHGLYEHFKDEAKLYKSREIDLVVLNENIAYVIEVKTSSKPQSIYTAIGQLEIHSGNISKLLDINNVVRVLIIPEEPISQIKEIILKNLDIKIINYTITKKGRVQYVGLDKMI